MLYTVNTHTPTHPRTSLQLALYSETTGVGNEEKQHLPGLQVSPVTLVSSLKLGLCHPFHGCGA